MTIPASWPCGVEDRKRNLVDDLLVTTATIVLYHPLGTFRKNQDLGLPAKGKNRGMAETILGFKEPVAEERLVRHMTVVTGGCLPVAAMGPASICRSHDVTIDTRLGSIA